MEYRGFKLTAKMMLALAFIMLAVPWAVFNRQSLSPENIKLGIEALVALFG